jgi:hypothetical protein
MDWPSPPPIYTGATAELGDRLLTVSLPALPPFLPTRLRWWQVWWREACLMWRDLWVGLTS